MSEGLPPNTSTSSFPTTQEPTILPMGSKPKEYFAGCQVFDVTSDEYSKLMRGSKKWDRWNRYFDESGTETCKDIKNYLYKNPQRTVVLRNKTTQDMVYFKPRGKSEQ